MKAVRSHLKARRDQPTEAEQALAVAASIFAAQVAGMDRRSVAAEFGLTGPQVDRVVAAIPPAIRRAIEQGADDPRSEVARWRAELARREARSCEMVVMMQRIADAVLIEWKTEEVTRLPTLGEQVFRRWFEGASYDKLATEFGIKRSRAVYLVARLRPASKQRIKREVRAAREAAQNGT